MFIVTLFIVTKNWKQPECFYDGYIHVTVDYYSAIKRNKLIHGTAWMNLRHIVLAENSLKRLHTVWFHL